MMAARKALTARSVLLSVLLGTDPPRLPVQLLVRTAALFGIPEGTARTALSRMAVAGEVAGDGDGWYGITADHLLARQARQTASRRARTDAWDGRTWLEAVVVAGRRRSAADRATLRATLAAARLSELREGVWLRPDNLEEARSIEAEEVRWFRSAPVGDPKELARRLWDLDGWAHRARGLQSSMAALLDPLVAGDRQVLAEGFVVSADVLPPLQSAPLLPRVLLPPDWPGGALRDGYDRYDDAYRSVLGRWFGEHG